LYVPAVYLQTDLALSEHVIRQGQKHVVEGRNWARLANKLAMGSSIKIAAFGGSVTVGYRMSNTSYPEQFVSWMQEAFPSVKFELVNLARRATAATFAALCLVQDLPEDTDLVLIEYSVNGYGG
jgi:lysophospholipase L1-like esterase